MQGSHSGFGIFIDKFSIVQFGLNSYVQIRYYNKLVSLLLANGSRSPEKLDIFLPYSGLLVFDFHNLPFVSPDDPEIGGIQVRLSVEVVTNFQRLFFVADHIRINFQQIEIVPLNLRLPPDHPPVLNTGEFADYLPAAVCYPSH